MTEGWICPKCGAVWSPTTVGCLNCNLSVSYKVSPETGGLYQEKDSTTGGTVK